MQQQSPWRKDFPFLTNTDHCYLDSAATSLKPQSVIDAVTQFYTHQTANLARGDHFLTRHVTQLYEQTRLKVAQFINAHAHEVIFTANCTDSLNMLAMGLNLKENDEILVSHQNHHAALLPFMARSQIIYFPEKEGLPDTEQAATVFTPKTRLMVIPMTANTTGNRFPIKELCLMAKQRGVMTIVDAAQSVGHETIDVCELGCDFLCFSAHKMLAPSGVGVTYGRWQLLQELDAVRLGGGMVNKVTENSYELMAPPHRFESGTPNLEGVIGLGAAIDYLNSHDFEAMQQHLQQLEKSAKEQLSDLPGIITTFDYAKEHAPIFNIHIQGHLLTTSQLANLLADRFGIITNLGQQCCQSLYVEKNLKEGIRISFYIYNDKNDITRLIEALSQLTM